MNGRLGLCLLGSIVAVNAMDGGNKPQTTAVTTEPEFDVVKVAIIQEFDRTKRVRCGGSTLTSKTCWQDVDGNSFRYGCIDGDTRILTDACEANDCSDCEGQWKWGGEQQETCYDDGAYLYNFNCGAGDNGDAEAPQQEAPQDATQIETSGGSSCAKLGWPLQPGDLTVCGASKVNFGECASDEWSKAAGMCESLGARLCTSAELLNDETKGTGCKADCASVWSSNTCSMGDGSDGHILSAGANKCKKKFPSVCSKDTVSAPVRCCADASVGGNKSPESYPPGYSEAVSRDYKLSDGNCGKSDAISTYSCWTNPANMISMRFACSDANGFVFHQFCGTDSECDPSSCSGEWAKTGEMVDQCYARKAEGYLYHYSCPYKN